MINNNYCNQLFYVPVERICGHMAFRGFRSGMTPLTVSDPMAHPALRAIILICSAEFGNSCKSLLFSCSGPRHQQIIRDLRNPGFVF